MATSKPTNLRGGEASKKGEAFLNALGVKFSDPVCFQRIRFSWSENRAS
jgi:hypothetical protein